MPEIADAKLDEELDLDKNTILKDKFKTTDVIKKQLNSLVSILIKIVKKYFSKFTKNNLEHLRSLLKRSDI